MVNQEKEVYILISKQALDRIKNDRFVKQNRNWYESQIIMLGKAPFERPKERLGNFNVSPRGHEKRRIAWHLEIKENTIIIFIDDLLYHITEDKYVENWNIKVVNKKINLKDYGPYLPFVGL